MEQAKPKVNIFYSYSFIFMEKLSVHAKILFLYLSRLADRSGKCFPSQRRIARCCKMSKSTVGNAIRELEQAKVITRDKRLRHDGMQTSNWYKIKTTSASWFYSYTYIFEMDISIYAKIIYIYFCRMADDKGTCFPSRKKISLACSIGLTKVSETIKELEDVGLIKRKTRFRSSNNGQTSNLYTVFSDIG